MDLEMPDLGLSDGCCPQGLRFENLEDVDRLMSSMNFETSELQVVRSDDCYPARIMSESFEAVVDIHNLRHALGFEKSELVLQIDLHNRPEELRPSKAMNEIKGLEACVV
jgi:hypothetical protein